MELRYKGYTLGGGSGGGSGVPPGFIGMWSGETVPDGWALCDGTNGTPDLRGRFVLGESDSHAMGSIGGSEEVTLTVEQMPEHQHSTAFIYSYTLSDGYANDPVGLGRWKTQTSTNKATSLTGSSQPHPNMPPYYVLAFIMKL